MTSFTSIACVEHGKFTTQRKKMKYKKRNKRYCYLYNITLTSESSRNNNI